MIPITTQIIPSACIVLSSLALLALSYTKRPEKSSRQNAQNISFSFVHFAVWLVLSNLTATFPSPARVWHPSACDYSIAQSRYNVKRKSCGNYLKFLKHFRQVRIYSNFTFSFGINRNHFFKSKAQYHVGGMGGLKCLLRFSQN